MYQRPRMWCSSGAQTWARFQPVRGGVQTTLALAAVGEVASPDFDPAGPGLAEVIAVVADDPGVGAAVEGVGEGRSAIPVGPHHTRDLSAGVCLRLNRANEIRDRPNNLSRPGVVSTRTRRHNPLAGPAGIG